MAGQLSRRQLSTKQHVNKIACACFSYHIRRLRYSPLCQQRSPETADHSSYPTWTTVTPSSPVSLPLCNVHRMPPPDSCSVLTAGPASQQLRVAAGQALHHLQSQMRQALHRRCSPYLLDLVAFSSTDSHRQLRSTTARAARDTENSDPVRDFSVCVPDVWNSLPPSVCTVDFDSSYHVPCS